MAEMNYFALNTETLNGHMRTIADVLASQIAENPGAPPELRRAVDALQEMAINFTNVLYADPTNKRIPKRPLMDYERIDWLEDRATRAGDLVSLDGFDSLRAAIDAKMSP